VLPRSSRDSGLLLQWATHLRCGTHLQWATHLRWVTPLAVVVGLGLSGCSGGEAPGPTAPARPAQPTAATKAAPASAPEPASPPYVYEAKGRRDPFSPLIAPRVVEDKTRPKPGLAGLNVNELKLAGIIWESHASFALVEAPNGAGYVLRVNDIVGENARVTDITPEAVTFEVKDVRAGAAASQPARTRVVELRLKKKEG
jgi:Tfp pilus assembly protein PilP